MRFLEAFKIYMWRQLPCYLSYLCSYLFERKMSHLSVLAARQFTQCLVCSYLQPGESIKDFVYQLVTFYTFQNQAFFHYCTLKRAEILTFLHA